MLNKLSHRWPEGAIVYHIYPRSFQDSNSDGIGDLPGITSRLGYLRTLGVNVIWLSPFYPSPMADFGYDIADYCNVDPIFGTLSDFKDLLAAAREHEIKVIVDLVPNHSSDAHQWFQMSRQSKDNPKSDWYVWRDALGKDMKGQPVTPNNWLDVLTGRSAWQWDELRKQFYLHSFDVRQPDLNWMNPDVRDAFKNIMRFWLDLGVDGFRVDAVYWLAKEPLLTDDAQNPDFIEGEDVHYNALLHNNSRGWPPVYAYLSEMCDVLKEQQYQDKPRFMVTEAYPERHNVLAAYMMFYVGMDPRVAAPFNFEGVSLPWEASPWRHFLKRFHTALDQLSPLCVASYAFGNHDQPRLATRLGPERARSVAVLLLTLPGMAFIYYGEELGMEDGDIPQKFVQDPAAKGHPSGGAGRDPERTPMQWTPGKNAGFSDAPSTWLPLAENYPTHNVAVESEHPDSFLSMYRFLGTLRQSSDTLKYGSFTMLDSGNEEVLMYERSYAHDVRYAVCVNFSDRLVACELPVTVERMVISTVADTGLRTASGGTAQFQPFEAAIFVLRPGR